MAQLRTVHNVVTVIVFIILAFHYSGNGIVSLCLDNAIYVCVIYSMVYMLICRLQHLQAWLRSVFSYLSKCIAL